LPGVLRLITIPISHYCEKARWALDRAGIAYREERHIQGVHQVVARRAGGGRTVPVLVTPEGVLAESADILDWVDERMPPDRRLFPPERPAVEALCARFDAVLGPHGRRLMYVHVMRDPKLLFSFNNAGVPRWEDRLLRIGWPVLARFVSRRLDITPGIEVEDEAVVWREFDFAAELLSDGRPYLCGEHFSAADLTFAALAAPAVVPPEYTVALPQPETLPGETAAIVERAREHPAGRHALEMFRQRRRDLPKRHRSPLP
jgi:glutathione S-transferase